MVFRLATAVRVFSVFQSIQTGTGANSASFSMGNEGSILEGNSPSVILYLLIDIYIYIYIYIYVCVCVCVCVHIYIYIGAQKTTIVMFIAVTTSNTRT